MDGIETLQKMRQIRQNIPIVIMSGHGSIETAVKATKLGAFDYLEKPLSLEKILPIMAHAKDLKVVRSQMSLATAGTPYEILGQSQEIELIRNQIGMVAPRNAWVLITGENGTGKEVVARNIHAQSSRANGPFVAVNCAAIPEELIESELFGHAKGAFTNAIAAKKGRFEVAHQGTLFLDEIADMSLKTQAKILRILQEQKFERVGETTPLTVDVRVVAATNKDLVGEIAAGRFREDLFYRLNVVPFRVPALRERRIDIPVLANFFLTQTATNLKEPRKSLSPAAMEVLQSYPWPGNVRELKNLVERLCIMIPRAEIMDSDLPEAIQRRDGSQETSAYSIAAGSLREAKADFERAFILEKLEEFGWNVSKTAEAIGIERSNLHRKLRTYNIDPKKLKG
jgi:two-component system nitrogen regulation response regulator NtrX